MKEQTKPNLRKNLRKKKGIVVSNKTAKTVVVRVDRLKTHPLYKKQYKVSKKYHAHTDMECQIGDVVLIEESRPLAKTKFWKVVEVIKEKKEAK